MSRIPHDVLRYTPLGAAASLGALGSSSARRPAPPRAASRPAPVVADVWPSTVGSGSGPLGSDCTSDDDCATGNCLGGYCAPNLGVCTLNAHWDSTSCVCDAGYQWSQGWPRECIQIPQAGPPVGSDPSLVCVQGGGQWDGTNCTYPPAACGPGTTDNGLGGCRPVTAADCGQGETFDPLGAGGYKCFACPGAGTIYNLAAHTCVCPDGQQWSDSASSCAAKVAGAPPVAAVPPPAPTQPTKTPAGTPPAQATGKKSNVGTIVAVAAVGAAAAGLGLWLATRKKSKR